MQAQAPGKLILSGEHSVVYGAPALAVAIDLHSVATLKPQQQQISTELVGIEKKMNFSPAAALETCRAIDQRYLDYREQKINLDQVIENANQLAVYCLLQLAPPKSLPPSVLLRTSTQLLTAAGMGSSASVIAAIIVLAEKLFNRPLSIEKRCELVRYCERLIHGKGSILDAACVSYGGSIKVQQQRVEPQKIQLDNNWHWAYSGKSANSTGQCVDYVRQHHGAKKALWAEFAAISDALIAELIPTANSAPTSAEHKLIQIIRENHRLLVKIGVVPQAVVELINSIEQAGGGAKISGAGAISGASGGIIIAYLPAECKLKLAQIMPQLHFEPLAINSQGAFLSTENGQ